MFGFENIGELAHHLETLYDLVRQGKMQVSDGLISVTLHAFDKVRDLLKEKDAIKIANAEELKDHLKIAIEFLKSAETELAMAHDFLTTYLNDHLAGSQSALEILDLLHRLDESAAWQDIKREIEADRQELEQLIRSINSARTSGSGSLPAEGTVSEVSIIS